MHDAERASRPRWPAAARPRAARRRPTAARRGTRRGRRVAPRAAADLSPCGSCSASGQSCQRPTVHLGERAPGREVDQAAPFPLEEGPVIGFSRRAAGDGVQQGQGRARYGTHRGSLRPVPRMRQAAPVGWAGASAAASRGRRGAVALDVVAPVAGRDDVLPLVHVRRGCAGPRGRSSRRRAAVDTPPAVTHEDRAPGERHGAAVRHPHEAGEAYDDGHPDRRRGAVQDPVGISTARSPCGPGRGSVRGVRHDAQRFVRRVEDKRSALLTPSGLLVAPGTWLAPGGGSLVSPPTAASPPPESRRCPQARRTPRLGCLRHDSTLPTRRPPASTWSRSCRRRRPTHAVADPYRWLEDADDPRTQAWSRAQDELFARRRATWPGRERLARRGSTELLGAGVVSRARLARRAGSSSCAARPSRSTPCCSPSTPTAPSATLDRPDGARPDRHDHARRLAAVARRATCSPTSSPTAAPRSPCCACMDVATGEVVDGPIDRCRYSPVAWLPGGEAFYYVRRLAADLVPGGRGAVPPAGLPAPGRHRPGRGRRDDLRRRPATRPTTTASRRQPRRPLAADHAPPRAPRRATTCGSPTSSASRRSARRCSVVQEGVDAETGAAGRPRRPRSTCSPTSTRRAAGSCVTDAGRPGARALDATWSPRTPRRCSTDFAILDGDELDDPVLLVGWTRHAVSEISRPRPARPASAIGDGAAARPRHGRRHRRASRGRPRGVVRLHRPHHAAERSTATTRAPARRRCGRRAPGAVDVPARARPSRSPTPRADGTDGADVRASSPAGEPDRPAPDDPLRLRRLRHAADARLLRRRSSPGSRPAASTRSPTCAAAARRARTGTAPACSATSRTSSTTSTPPPSS